MGAWLLLLAACSEPTSTDRPVSAPTPSAVAPGAPPAPAPSTVPPAVTGPPPGTSLPGGAHAGPNVLLITVDTLRADHLGAYGYGRRTSPHIDALAAGGVRYERVYAARGATWPSLTTLMTSWYPVEHGVRDNSTQVSDAPTTLAEVLASRGYHTAAWMTNAEDAHWEGIAGVQPVRDEPLDATAAERVSHRLGEAIEQPFFYWVHLTAPHDPYVNHPDIASFLDRRYRGPIDDTQGSLVRFMFAPPSDADRAAVLARYDSEVAASDAAIGRILDALHARGLDRTTLVVVSADHGDELGDHPPYLFHFASPWDAVLHVPLIARQPDVLPSGVVVPGAAGLIDVAPTILDWLGIAPPAAWRGLSLAPPVTGGARPDRPVISELLDQVLVVHQGPWARLWNPRGYAGALAPPQQLKEAGLDVPPPRNAWPIPRSALYDVTVDPTQQHDVAAQNPTVGKELDAALSDFRARTGWPGQMPGMAPPAIEQQLQSLGYTSKGAH